MTRASQVMSTGGPLSIIFIGVRWAGGILKIGFIGIFIGSLVAAYPIITSWLAEMQKDANSETAT